MKYTSFILNSNCFNIDSIISHIPIIKQLTIIFGIFVAIIGVCTISGLIMLTVPIDIILNIKDKCYKYHQLNTLLLPLSIPIKQRIKLIKSLTKI